jgi:hypothetical protein
MFENTPSHVQQEYAGQTLLWCSSDSKERFAANLKNDHTKKLLEMNTWLNARQNSRLTYNFNSEGFRSREITTERRGFAVFGCSFTTGVGLPYNELYHKHIECELRLPADNFGVLGASNGLMFRIAQYWLPIVRPHFVIVQTTFAERFEIINQYNASTVMSPQWEEAATQHVFRNWWLTDANSIVDKQRNILAMRYLCHELDIPIFVIDVEDFRNPMLGLSRDLDHSGPNNHHLVAENLIKQICAHPRFRVLNHLLPLPAE